MLSQHEATLRSSINLVASENLISANVRRALASDVSMRYCIPPEGERPPAIWDYPNQTFVRAIAKATEQLACQLFHAAYADVRPLSGNQIAQIILMSLVSRGDTVWSIPAECGGHFATRVIAAREGLNLIPIPYDWGRGVIDVEAARRLAAVHPPKLIFLDASMQLFPHPLKALREAVGTDPIISFDASHTMGLIAGGAFQTPLLEGADLLHGSTHKSLWGPQKGLITVRDAGSVATRIHDAVVPMFVSNVHVHHVAALGLALEECLEFGAAYASEVISNARTLAGALSSHGVKVLFSDQGATQSHQVMVELGEKTHALDTWRRLQSAGLHCNAISLPFRTASYGLRLGLAEATRRGLGRSEMLQLGTWMAECIHQTTSPDDLRKDVMEMSNQFCHLAFSHQASPVV